MPAQKTSSRYGDISQTLYARRLMQYVQGHHCLKLLSSAGCMHNNTTHKTIYKDGNHVSQFNSAESPVSMQDLVLRAI